MPTEAPNQATTPVPAPKKPTSNIIQPKIVPLVKSAGTLLRDRFVAQIHEHRNTPPVIHVPSPVSARMAEQTALEMATGAARVAQNVEQQKNRPAHVAKPGEAYTTPVYRPKDHVPKLDSLNDAARGYKAL